MPPVLLIALDAQILSHFVDSFPNLRKIKEKSHEISMSSIFPPKAPSAWASIYTGLNPAQHGIVYFVDPLEKLSAYADEDEDNKIIRGKTFWDIAGRHGKRVCVMFPFLGYPIWPVNGIMVGRSTKLYNNIYPVQAYPRSIENQYDLMKLSPIKSVPQKKLYSKYIESYHNLVSSEAEFSLKLLKQEQWDLFFIYSSALDWVGHNLWSYFDENDPAYPGGNPFQEVMFQFYQQYDEIIGKLIDGAGPDTAVIIFSDHGQMRRPSRLVNINWILSDEGLLMPRIKRHNITDPIYMLESVKKGLTKIVNRYGAGRLTMKVIHRAPNIRKMFTRPLSIDWDKTIACVSDLSGIKAYSYGGIIIARDRLGGRNYEELRDFIIQKLQNIRVPGEQRRVIKWVRRREELYSGAYLLKYPDVVFQMEDDFGVGWAVNEPLITPCETHNIQPGSHKEETAVLLVYHPKGIELNKRQLTLTDIAPIVLI
ncbi:MAG: alkaline phosphatase family protein, partial [Candidatus Tectomicrobia bacterium]|nr:alkaline phosphatase family protein [Candidatus Tectomicrobia bacterium]